MLNDCPGTSSTSNAPGIREKPRGRRGGEALRAMTGPGERVWGRVLNRPPQSVMLKDSIGNVKKLPKISIAGAWLRRRHWVYKSTNG